MRKTREAAFFIKPLQSGYYVVYANGDPNWINASYRTVTDVRNWIDQVCRVSKITSYFETFNEEEYNTYLTEHAYR